MGTTSRADVYRWQGEVANARKDLISAESQVRVAVLDLKRILNRPLDRPMAQHEVSLGDPGLLAEDSTVLAWFDQPERFARLMEFLVTESLRISPELAQADAAIAAQRRQRTAAGRAFWLPTFSLQGGLSNVFNRGGAGSNPPPLPPSFSFPRPPDLTWQVQAEASLPLFTGFERIATRIQTGLDLDRLQVERDNVRLSLDQRVRAAIETAASTYAAIALTRDASEAANRNYELVSDAYAEGAPHHGGARRTVRGGAILRVGGERGARFPARSHEGRAGHGSSGLSRPIAEGSERQAASSKATSCVSATRRRP